MIDYSEAIKNIAQSIVVDAAHITSGQKVLLWYDVPAVALIAQLEQLCLSLGAHVSHFHRDLEKDARLIPTLTDTEIDHYFDAEQQLIESADHALLIRSSENPEILNSLPPDKFQRYRLGYSRAHRKRIDDSVKWTLFLWPTQYEARKELLAYDDYLQLVIKACNQPWEQIAQAQQKLVDLLDHAKTLELFANATDSDPLKRTHLTMSIDGMTFCNSTIDSNYPGSEVFSAPVKDSVNGQLFAPGEYLYSGQLMSNIRFVIENGKIVEAVAEKNNSGLQTILANGPGARYFGEIAFGTNPGLTRRFFNPLLNEKVSGSFHLAVGHCYGFSEFLGKPINVNNGNTEDKTPIHWDITILMHPQYGGGKIVVDGTVISENGQFLDHDLALLNPTLNQLA